MFNNIIELKLILGELLNSKFETMTLTLKGAFNFMKLNSNNYIELLKVEDEIVKLKIIKSINGTKILDKLPPKVVSWVVSSNGFNQGFSTCCLEYVDSISGVELSDLEIDGAKAEFNWLDNETKQSIDIPKFIDWCCDNNGANSVDFTLINNNKRLNLTFQEGTIIRKSFYKGDKSIITLSNADNFDSNFIDCPLIKLNYYSTNLTLMSKLNSWEEIAKRQGISFNINSRYLSNNND